MGTVKGIVAGAIVAIIAGTSGARAEFGPIPQAFEATYSGVVVSGIDYANVFGLGANASLDGDAFQVEYVFVPSFGYTFASPTLNYAYYSCCDPSATDPVLSATFILFSNGVEHQLSFYSPFSFDYAYAWNDGTASGQSQAATVDPFNYVTNYVSHTTTGSGDLGFPAGWSMSVSATFPVVAADGNYGAFSWNADPDRYSAQAYALLSNSSVTIGPYSTTIGPQPGIPETSTWIMAASGLVGVALLRLRQRGHRA